MRTLGLRLDREELILEEIPLEPLSLWNTFFANLGIIWEANPRGYPSRTHVPLEYLFANLGDHLGS